MHECDFWTPKTRKKNQHHGPDARNYKCLDFCQLSRLCDRFDWTKTSSPSSFGSSLHIMKMVSSIRSCFQADESSVISDVQRPCW